MTKLVNGREVLEDGERITVKAMLMDGMQTAVVASAVITNDAAIGHKPGFVTMTDAALKAKTDAYAAYNARLTDAWKNPVPVATPRNHQEPINQLNAQIGAVNLNTPGDPNAEARIAAEKRRKEGGAGADAYNAYNAKISERWRGTAAA